MTQKELIRQEIERRMLELARDKYIDLHDTLCRTKELNLLLAFIDSLPEDHFRDSTKMISEELEEAADNHIRKIVDAAGHPGWDWTSRDIKDAFIAGAEWQKSQMPMPEDTVIFMKGVAEGRRLEREEREENKRKEDELPRFYGD